MKRRLLVILSAIVCTLCLAFTLTACRNANNESEGGWTLQRAYAEATELGYNGSLEDFLETIKGKDGQNGEDGVSITYVGIDENGNLIVTLSNGQKIDCGKIPPAPMCKHNFDDGHIIFAPTCEEAGLGYWTCTVCELSKIEEIEATGHKWKDFFESDYYFHYSECENCNEINQERHLVEDNKCAVCDYGFKVTEGLSYTLNSSNTYSVTGIGSATDIAIVIPNTYNNLPVTAIGYEAFRDCKDVKNIIIPDSITDIGGSAFSGSGIVGIKIPDSVTSIGNGIFENCSELMFVELGSGFSEWNTMYDGDFGYRAFKYFGGCRSLTSIVVPYGITLIGTDLFTDCISLQNIYYTGTASQWADIKITGNNSNFIDATVFYYSESNPYVDGVEELNFWRYVDGEIIVWEKKN